MRWLSRSFGAAVPSRRRVSSLPPRLEQLEDRLTLSATWVSLGPGPILQGQPKGLDPQGNPDVGAVNALALDPTNPNVLYAATTDGGVW